MDRKVIYNGRVSKVEKPRGLRPSDYKGMFSRVFEQHAATTLSGIEIPNLDFEFVSKNGIIEVHSRKGDLLFMLDPKTGQVFRADEKDKDMVAG